MVPITNVETFIRHVEKYCSTRQKIAPQTMSGENMMYGHRCVISHISVLLSSSAAGCSSYLCHVLQTQPLDIPFLGFHQTTPSIKLMLKKEKKCNKLREGIFA